MLGYSFVIYTLVMSESEEEELLFFETFSHDNSEVSKARLHSQMIAKQRRIGLPDFLCHLHGISRTGLW